MTSRDRPDPAALTPRDAVQRYLRRRSSDATEASVYSWWYRLKLWITWCEDNGIANVGGLSGYDLDEYYEHRSATIAPATLEGEMWTLKKLFEYLEQLEAVDDGLAKRVRIPDVDDADRTDNTQLVAENALAQLRWFRNEPAVYGTREHVFLELAWIIGARQGGLRALDVRDVHIDDRYVEFRHRPKTGTPLKNKIEGERPVSIPDETSDALRRYVRHHRHDVHDEYGRQPFIASIQGRPGKNTLRVWSYLATLPCRRGPCPHGRDRQTCGWTEYAHASKCPSSRSPHQIRTGSITWQLNIGIPPGIVSVRVNADPKTIRAHYDKATDEERYRRQRERMERDRRHFVDNMDIDLDLDELDDDLDTNFDF